MSYCNIHNTNNCIECAIAEQTKEIVKAIRALSPPDTPPTAWQAFKHRVKIIFSGPDKK